jgi:16S rRNA (adenine1518-N6/adenine1519-N6)-dimethyltransferase
MTNISFVDDDDKVIGVGPRQQAKELGINHRVVRIFLLNSSHELLIQKRSSTVAFPNLWDQSAGGHVDEGEDYDTAAIRELNEEIGVKNVPLIRIKKYFTEEKAANHTMRRFNMLYTAIFDGIISIDNDEVSGTKWIALDELEQWMKQKPNEFTEGFVQAFEYYIGGHYTA